MLRQAAHFFSSSFIICNIIVGKKMFYFCSDSEDHFEKNDIDYSHDLIQARALAEYFKKNNMNQYYKGVELLSI